MYKITHVKFVRETGLFPWEGNEETDITLEDGFVTKTVHGLGTIELVPLTQVLEITATGDPVYDEEGVVNGNT